MDNNNQKKKIIDFVSSEVYKPMKKKEMASLMQVPQEEKPAFNDTINELTSEGKITITKRGKIIQPDKLGLVAGTFIGNAGGFGFVSTDEPGGGDIFIPPGNVNGAIHKDKVLCGITAEESGNMRREGYIAEIIKHGFNEIIGTYLKHKGFGYVVPDEKKIGGYIYVSQSRSLGAVTGHKVAVKLESAALDGDYAKGFVTEILGHKNDPGIDVYSIIRHLELRTEFGKKVHAELQDISEEIQPECMDGRTDLRSEFLITIDGEDTKDIDDAVSYQKLENGNYRLGVHIADVSHYVKEGSELDREAYKRGTSVYLADRVIPMLPHKLSNGICSLNKNADRLALSCIMEINSKGIVVGSKILNTVINVKRQITYTALNDLLTSGTELGQNTDDNYLMFKEMEELAAILKEKRVRRGAIEFDFPEAKIIVDDNGWPVDIVKHPRNAATGIIEEFMIICNETIAETFFWMEIPFIYRTHEEPDDDKITRLSDFIRNFGYSLRKNVKRPGSLQELLIRAYDTPEETVISRVVLRSMKQARYTPQNIGHFGLASKYYCHFTSPIRRYPDLLIHRLIKEHLANGISKERLEFFNGIMLEVCRQCSTTERIAESAEQEVEKLKKAQYMTDKIGMEFEGIVSGLTAWGVYVMLDDTVEGMISKGSLGDEKYNFNQDLMRYEGNETGKIITLGDKVKVRLVNVNVDDRTIDFDLCRR